MKDLPFSIYLIGLLLVILTHLYLLAKGVLPRSQVRGHALINLISAFMIAYGYTNLYKRKGCGKLY